jgi:multisubunit Na+/H+ antiporter MnhG subunit
MKYLLLVTAAIEAGAGVALLIFPSATAALLLGSQLDRPPSMALVRVVGAILLVLGVACWLASRDMQKPCARRMAIVMTAYNIIAAIALCAIGIGAPSVGVLLWPAVALHAAMEVWCVVCLMKKPSNA